MTQLGHSRGRVAGGDDGVHGLIVILFLGAPWRTRRGGGGGGDGEGMGGAEREAEGGS